MRNYEARTESLFACTIILLLFCAFQLTPMTREHAAGIILAASEARPVSAAAEMPVMGNAIVCELTQAASFHAPEASPSMRSTANPARRDSRFNTWQDFPCEKDCWIAARPRRSSQQIDRAIHQIHSILLSCPSLVLIFRSCEAVCLAQGSVSQLLEDGHRRSPALLLAAAGEPMPAECNPEASAVDRRQADLAAAAPAR